jgi:hypothetical protein
MKLFWKEADGKKYVSLLKNIGNYYIGYAVTSNPIPPTTNPIFTPQQFHDNPLFYRVLNDTLSKYVLQSPTQQALAKHFQSGFMNINDIRSPQNWGRTADPEDILGTILVKDGKMIPGTFEAMPSHRLYSSHGFFQLEPFLVEKLLETLKQKE